MKCICLNKEISELHGVELQDYVKHHLRLIEINKKWETSYECPDTGVQWLEDFPDSQLHGGGTPRLRKIFIMPKK